MQMLEELSHTYLLFETLVVTAVTDASETASISGPVNKPRRSRFSVSRIAGSSGDATLKKIKGLLFKTVTTEVQRNLTFVHVHKVTGRINKATLLSESVFVSDHLSYVYLHVCPPCVHVYCASLFQCVL